MKNDEGEKEEEEEEMEQEKDREGTVDEKWEGGCAVCVGETE